MDRKVQPQTNYKKKNKGNFLRQTKRNGKKGIFGKGNRLSEEEYHYYLRVYEQLKHTDGLEKEILVQNFIQELKREGQEKRLACNQIVSRILDDALPFADTAQVLGLSRIFLKDLRQTCVDAFASHVLQTLLTLSLKYAQKNAVQKRSKEPDGESESNEEIISVTDEEKEEFCTFMIKVGRFVYNNLEEFVCHTYASHVIRSVLEVCSGVEVRDTVKSSQRSHTNHALFKDPGIFLTVPPELKQLLQDMVIRFTRLPKLPEIIRNDCGSAVLQSLIMVVGGVEKELYRNLVTHILRHGFSEMATWFGSNSEEYVSSDVPLLFQDNCTVHLLEVIVTCCTSEQQSEVFQQYFKGNMKAFARHRLANFAVQRLLSSWKEKDTFGDLCDEMCEALEEAFLSGHMGVVHALAQACRRLKSKQSRCMQAIMQLLQCWEPERLQIHLVPLLLWMLPFDAYETQRSEGKLPPVSLQGTLTIQELLCFEKPIKVVKSLLMMDSANLRLMACDPRGSHVIDAFTSGPFVGSKSQDKLIWRYQGMYSSLACSKHGSRSLEALWKVAGIKLRTRMCSELLGDELKLKGSPFGIIIFTNFKVDLFKRGNRSDWEQLIDKTDKKRKMFDDLLKEDGEDKTKKKMKGKTEEEKMKKLKEKEERYDSFGDIFIDQTGTC
ncbi:LOW QUALITY PROTEIN: nucleolar protein 9 [Panulirus ornatus]|uniref:LOW QUALITY PROTEIN: nucleolar protein 9 n=1 Tax=Panulirus ornatus TaxID=150431 RepID=UPI003A8C0169